MAYQSDPENMKEIEFVEEETTFFSNTNKWRMFALLAAGVIATVFVVNTHRSSPTTKGMMLDSIKLSKGAYKDVLKTPTSVEDMLTKYGLMFDRKKMLTKQYKSSYGRYNPKTSGVRRRRHIFMQRRCRTPTVRRELLIQSWAYLLTSACLYALPWTMTPPLRWVSLSPAVMK